MHLTYEKRNEGLSVEWKDSVHVPPHLHEAIEVIYVTDGTVELGVGQELFHMEKGDFAIVFPNVIHHYQVFDSGKNKAIYLYLEPSLTPGFMESLQKYSPKYPIISKDRVHVDYVNSVKALVNLQEFQSMIIQAHPHSGCLTRHQRARCVCCRRCCRPSLSSSHCGCRQWLQGCSRSREVFGRVVRGFV